MDSLNSCISQAGIEDRNKDYQINQRVVVVHCAIVA